jgi:hypothetical protein
VHDDIPGLILKTYGLEWGELKVQEAPIEISRSADIAEAKLGGGQSASVKLQRDPGADGRGVVLRNVNRLLLRGWRQQAIEAEVRGGGAVMVGPVVGEGDQCESPRCFATAPDLNRIAQRGVRYFRHRGIAEVE